MSALRVGLIGAGGISRVHVVGWQEVGADVTVYSTDGGRRLAAEFGLDVAPSLTDVLSRVDAVDIAVPSAAHADVALAAISADIPVVCEKPLAATHHDALEIARASRAAGVPVYPAHVVRYFPEYAAIKRAVDAGRIGTPAVLRFTRAGQAPPAGSWFFDMAAGGGIVLDQMIHDLDQARWMAGEVTQVYAVQNPPAHDGMVPPVVTAHVVLTHVTGAISHVQGVWGPPGLTFRTSVAVAGSEGMLEHASPEDGLIGVDIPAASGGAGDYLPAPNHTESPYTAEIREFAAAIAGGPAPRVTLEDGVVAVALAEAAVASIRTDLPVSFDADAARQGGDGR